MIASPADAAVREQLAELGIVASRSDESASMHLERGRSKATYRLLTEPTTRHATAAQDFSEESILVVASHIAARTAELYRRLDIQFIDAAGNASLHFGDVLIDVRGRKRPSSGAAVSPPTTGAPATNTFSAARAQVACVLLTWPELWSAPHREIAACAGVSLGLAHDALAALREDNLAASASRGRLLEIWTAAFPTGLRRRISLAEFHGDPLRELAAGDLPIAIGGEAAVADLVRPTTLTVYVPELDNQLIVNNRWRTDGDANVFVRRMFWQAPTGAAGEPSAPWPLTYADLATSDDPRLRSAAPKWRDRFV